MVTASQSRVVGKPRRLVHHFSPLVPLLRLGEFSNLVESVVGANHATKLTIPASRSGFRPAS